MRICLNFLHKWPLEHAFGGEMNMHEVALPRYTEDFALWLESQLNVLRERNFQQLDVHNP